MVAIRNPESLEILLMGSTFKTPLAVPANAWTYIAVAVNCLEGGTGGEGGQEQKRSLTVWVGTGEPYSVVLPDLRFDRSGMLVLGQLQTCGGGCFDRRSGFQGFIEGVRLWNTTLDGEQVAADRARPVAALSTPGSSPTDVMIVRSWPAPCSAPRNSSTTIG